MLWGISSISVMANVQQQFTNLSAIQSSRSWFTVPSLILPIYKQNQKPNQPSLTHCNTLSGGHFSCLVIPVAYINVLWNAKLFFFLRRGFSSLYFIFFFPYWSFPLICEWFSCSCTINILLCLSFVIWYCLTIDGIFMQSNLFLLFLVCFLKFHGRHCGMPYVTHLSLHLCSAAVVVLTFQVRRQTISIARWELRSWSLTLSWLYPT